MKEKEQDPLERKLDEQSFENAANAIEGGKENGGLTNVELVENLVESYKGKTAQAPVEVIVASAIFLNIGELMGTIKALEHTLHARIVEKLRKKADKGDAAAKDAMAALMLSAIVEEESEED